MGAIATNQLQAMSGLLGDWETTVTHPMLDGEHAGTATFEWGPGERFLVVRQTCGHPQIPDSVTIIGEPSEDVPASDAPLAAQYFDSRGVHRLYWTRFEDGVWRYWRDHPGFDQRFEGRVSEDGDVIDGLSQLRRQDAFEDDLAITYRRARP